MVKQLSRAGLEQFLFLFIIISVVIFLETYVLTPNQRFRPLQSTKPYMQNVKPPVVKKRQSEAVKFLPGSTNGGYGKGRRECRYGCCFEDPFSKTLPQLDNRYKNPCWYETQFDPEAQSVDWNKITQATRNQVARASFIESMRATWENRRNQTVQFKCVPYFNIIGNPKSGSTDLYSRLSRHQEIELPSLKEPQWYTWERFRPTSRNYSTNECLETPLNHYISLYDGASDEIEKAAKTQNKMMVTGDGSVNLFFFHLDWEFFENQTSNGPKTSIAEHIRSVNPNAKNILILRNPTDRLYSAYKYFSSKNENKSIEAFHNNVLYDIGLFNKCKSRKGSRACVYDRKLFYRFSLPRRSLTVGLYSVFLQDWLKVFKLNSQMKVLNFEVYKHNPMDHLDDVISFLGINPYSPEARYSAETLKVVNPTENKLPKMKAETQKLLDEFYEPYNNQLAEMLADPSYRFRRLDRG